LKKAIKAAAEETIGETKHKKNEEWFDSFFMVMSKGLTT
jgi:hypothetical protein